jgi:regulator of protease activity HflC (stomatin/prohibitin superfamily)
MTVFFVALGLVVLMLLGLAVSVRILKQYERGVQFRLGRVKDGARGPGMIFIIPLVDHVHRVSLRIVTMPIQSQGIITKDNVSVDVSAVAYYRVDDAVRSVVAIENVAAAIDQIAQTTLRAVVGRHSLDETLAETDKRWHEGDMRKRWTAAGMLVAEQQFPRIIGYRGLAKLVIAIERHALLVAPKDQIRQEVVEPVTV